MSDKFYVGQDLVSFADKGKYKPISRVTLMIDDKNCVTAGDDTGKELVATCYNATQAMADALLAQFKGYEYQAYEVEAANLNPAAELGDGLTADGHYVTISRMDDDGSGYPSPSAPGEAEMEDEYPSAGPMTQEFNRKIAQTNARITKTAEQIRLEVSESINNLSASITVELGNITQTVTGLNGKYAELQTTVDGVTVTTVNEDGTKTITLKDGIVTSDAIEAGVYIYSPAIIGGEFKAESENSFLLMTSTGLEAYVDDTEIPKMVLKNNSSIVQLILGAGTTGSGDYGRMFVWKDADGGGVHYIGGDASEAYFGQKVGFEFGDDGVISFYGTLALDGLLSIEQGGVNYGYIGTSVESSVGGYGATLLDPTETNGFWAFSSGAKIQASEQNQVIATAPSGSSNGGVSIIAQGEYFYFNDEYFCPAHTPTLGTSSLKWGQIYSTNSAISTSDREKKNSIVYDIDERFDTLWSLLKPCTGKYNDGTSDRTHMFLISQDVESAIEEAGLTSQDFAAFIKSPKRDENFNVIEGYDYALRYEEFIPLCIRQIQKLQARVATLEGN